MNVEQFRELCLSLPGAQENAPWREHEYQNLITYSVAGKWFCLLDLDNKFCNIKGDPDQILQLQDQYQAIQPAWHMNKKHWMKILLETADPATPPRHSTRSGAPAVAASSSRISASRSDDLAVADVPDHLIRSLVTNSYNLSVASLPRRLRP